MSYHDYQVRDSWSGPVVREGYADAGKPVYQDIFGGWSVEEEKRPSEPEKPKDTAYVPAASGGGGDSLITILLLILVGVIVMIVSAIRWTIDAFSAGAQELKALISSLIAWDQVRLEAASEGLVAAHQVVFWGVISFPLMVWAVFELWKKIRRDRAAAKVRRFEQRSTAMTDDVGVLRCLPVFLTANANDRFSRNGMDARGVQDMTIRLGAARHVKSEPFVIEPWGDQRPVEVEAGETVVEFDVAMHGRWRNTFLVIPKEVKLGADGAHVRLLDPRHEKSELVKAKMTSFFDETWFQDAYDLGMKARKRSVAVAA